jgi:hypothetical protein
MNPRNGELANLTRTASPFDLPTRLILWIVRTLFFSAAVFRVVAQSPAAPATSIKFKLINPSVIQARLNTYGGSDTDREVSLLRIFQEAGCSTERLSEQAVKKLKQPNIICVLPGETSQEIIVGAHFDHAEIGEGVIDNWSGASLLPTLFQSLSGSSRKHTFVFIGFSGEESGEIGARYFLKHLTKSETSSISLMVNVDTIGLGPTKVWVSHSDKTAVYALAAIANLLKIPLSGVNVDGAGESDEEPFIEHKVKTITIHSLTSENLHILHSELDAPNAIKMSDYLDTYKLLAAYLAHIDTRLDTDNPGGDLRKK